ncbi:hypothetical protein Acry_1793 [Acidiphilium cryptum JF-5]|uniref:Uncharacterized protein n=1 Tax=Acidiphilium cryptum (strain JF-5) TaxID=349163 RepID=A5FZG4_ACICJ|nr:hypothetical protein Acry_1793 [Acidiphilium cryptum JF-5]
MLVTPRYWTPPRPAALIGINAAGPTNGEGGCDIAASAFRYPARPKPVRRVRASVAQERGEAGGGRHRRLRAGRRTHGRAVAERHGAVAVRRFRGDRLALQRNLPGHRRARRHHRETRKRRHDLDRLRHCTSPCRGRLFGRSVGFRRQGAAGLRRCRWVLVAVR